MVDLAGFGTPLGGMPALRLPAPLFLSLDSDPEIADRQLPGAPASSTSPPQGGTSTREYLDVRAPMEAESISKKEPPADKRIAAAAVAERAPTGVPLASDASTPAGVIEEIARQASLLPSRGATRLRIALSPAHLGELLIELSVDGALLHARVQTGSDAAKDLILEHLDVLRESLGQQGLRVGEFHVSVNPSLGRGPAAVPEETSRGSEEGQLPEARRGPRSIRSQILDVVA
jgi:flagellar hook-length control protein FliK